LQLNDKKFEALALPVNRKILGLSDCITINLNIEIFGIRQGTTYNIQNKIILWIDDSLNFPVSIKSLSYSCGSSLEHQELLYSIIHSPKIKYVYWYFWVRVTFR
jgi:hypothetical protein